MPVDNADAVRATRGILSAEVLMRILTAIRNRVVDDRGDVPGWVMICLMTCGLVIVIWALAGPALSSLFQHAIDRVTGF